MAATNDIFSAKVVPIMDKVRDELNRKKLEERGKDFGSFASSMSCGMGMDNGLGGAFSYEGLTGYYGKWNNKTVDDYVEMVKEELKKQNIAVDAVMEKKMIDRLIEQDMPKSSAEYIMKKMAEGTLFCIPQRMAKTSLQDHISKEADKRHDPSLMEDAAATVMSWAANAATTMGYGGFFGQLGVDASVAAVDKFSGGQQDGYLQKQAALAAKEVKEAGKRKVEIPKWMMKQMGFDSISKATDKQLAQAIKWADSNGSIYRDMVEQAMQQGNRTVKAIGTTADISAADATYRAMQYEAYASALQAEQQERNAGRDAVSYANVAEAEAPDATHPQKPQQANQPQQAQQTQATEEQPSKPKDDQPNQSQTQQTEKTENPQQSQQTQQTQQPKDQQTQSVQTQQTQTKQADGDYSGWNCLFDSMGMGGIGDTMQHLGVTLASLPDMLVGVFTGKTKSVGLNKGSLVPLAALISGIFIKNPLLKIPLMLFGGMSLLNKFGQEAMGEYRQADQKPKYKQYQDEALNARIKNPQIEGNVLLMDIDNTPRIVTLPQAAVEAYNTGALPINTLANRVLAKADTQMQAAIEASRTYEQSESRGYARGIR